MRIQDVKIQTVETEQLIQFLRIQLKENEKLNIGNFSIFENKFKIDPDCCFSEIENFHQIDKVEPMIQIDCRIEKHTKPGSFTIRMDKPDFCVLVRLDDYLKISKEMNLVDFIRYNYNPRIQANQRLLMEHINDAKP